MSESAFLRIGSAGGGSGVAGAFGLRANDDVEELERDTDLREVYDAFLGGNGGAAFWFVGGDSNCMRGGAGATDWRTIESDAWRTAPFTAGFVPTGFFWRGAYGRGPSSSTQSSINEVLRPRVGCDGDGERDIDFAEVDGVVGVMGKYALDDGETGASSKLGADLLALLMVTGLDDDNASKALILDFISRDTSSDSIGTTKTTSTTSWQQRKHQMARLYNASQASV